MRLCLIALAAALLSPVLSKADVLYSIVTGPVLGGAAITIDSSTYLTYSSRIVIPVTTTADLMVHPGGATDDLGTATGVVFNGQNDIFAVTDENAVTGLFLGVYNISTDGTYTDSDGDTLTISGAPSAVAVTPEPSSLLLLSTGVLAIAGVLKRSFA